MRRRRRHRPQIVRLPEELEHIGLGMLVQPHEADAERREHHEHRLVHPNLDDERERAALEVQISHFEQK